MTDMITAEEAGKLLDGTTPGPWRAEGDPWSRIVWSSADNRVCFMAHSNGLDDDRDIATSNLVAAAPDLARTVIALHAQLADARAAQAMVVERAAEGFENDTNLRVRICCNGQDCGCQGATADTYVAGQLRALADTDGLALVQEQQELLEAVRAQREKAVGLAETFEADRDRLAAANAALEAQVARLVGARPTLNWCRAEGQTIHEMRVNLQSSPFGQALIDMGDCALVWANEGDLYQFYATLAEVQADARPEGGE